MKKREILKALEIEKKKEEFDFWYKIDFKSLSFWNVNKPRRFNSYCGYGTLDKKKKKW